MNPFLRFLVRGCSAIVLNCEFYKLRLGMKARNKAWIKDSKAIIREFTKIFNDHA